MAKKWQTIDKHPKQSGRYLVTRTDTTRKDETKKWIDFGYWSSLSHTWFGNSWETVIAWKDAPAIYDGPYKVEKVNKDYVPTGYIKEV